MDEALDRVLWAIGICVSLQILTVLVVVFALWEKRNGDDEYKEGFRDGQESWGFNPEYSKLDRMDGLK